MSSLEFFWGLNNIHFIKHFDSGLNLSRFARFITKSLNKTLLLSEIFLLSSIVLKVNFSSFLFFFEKIFIPTVVKFKLLILDFYSFIECRSEKFSIMRNTNQSLIPHLTKPFDKHNSLDIQMICWLVKNKQVHILQKKFSNLDFGLFSSRKF